MDFSYWNAKAEIGYKYSDLGVLSSDSSNFLSESKSDTMLVIYIVLMVYLIGGLNILKTKFLYPCLEDLCAIFGEVSFRKN